MKSGAYPGSQAGVADMFAYDRTAGLVPGGYWLWNLRGQIAANMSSGNFSGNLPIFSMYLNDCRPSSRGPVRRWAARRGMRSRDDAVQRQRLLQRRQQLAERLVCHGVQPELQRAEHRQRPRDRAGHLAAVPGHGKSLVPAAVLPGDGAGRHVPAGVPERRLGRFPARGGERARDPVGGAGPDRRHRRGPGAVPGGDQRGDAAEHRFVAGVAAADRRGPDRALRAGQPVQPDYAAQRAADLGVRGRQCRRRGQRRDRRLLPAVGGDPQQREHRP